MEVGPPRRLRRLPCVVVLGYEVPVATGVRSRLLGLVWLERRRVGAGLLIPCCSSVHTFGMRFALDLHFLDEHGKRLAVHRAVPPRRLVFVRDARAVLEIPAGEGGEFSAGRP
jgi:uncharacterized membrane protein (UPF0127 family)